MLGKVSGAPAPIAADTFCFPEDSTAELKRQFAGRWGGWRSMNATPFWLHQACSWPRRVG